jgi:dephospho-CoA kinase
VLNILRETKQKSLEEIAAAFGDSVVDIDKHRVTAKMENIHGTPTIAQVKQR